MRENTYTHKQTNNPELLLKLSPNDTVHLHRNQNINTYHQKH